MNDMVEIFTDGACRGNPGPGGWGAVLRYREHERLLCGAQDDTTNNRMELTAAIRALAALPEGREAEILCDSRYVIQGIEEWMPGWVRRGWRTAGRKPVKNQDLWMLLAEKRKARPAARFRWVRGHTGHPDNERADALALDAARSQP